ncbi:hypothetical protein P175DRAFT_0435503 [Aspergillus ochraceoroseus IBT 24754]|uniref:Aminoglycoside phosphotransferase domain-containing protein n=2 Tax=Aspergillus ochraceoroseus TaxID=138278 RepID=A0A2T5M0H8_9EURO|nr:uncharacterized protein P175DRAFT_0435503 [Aspergillus ochraceoroseus IBT 24754]KKK12602.1 hypothetical protein AOCH_002283 [Aspergillus ochraceoroseus]PTU22033.1 hypothetical protein P175DRAFT_0435503 [Aspergillus ochraceoroseus IBT 24754]
MAAPDSYLPPSLPEEKILQLIRTLDLPTPKKIEPLQVTAAFHSIYLIHFTSHDASSIPARAEPDGTVILVLRVSGRQIPEIKTKNEVGVMTWIHENTKIPVPRVIRYSASEDNPIGYEFTLLEKAHGVSVDKVYPSLTMETKLKLIHQLTDYLVELHSHSWSSPYVGGLALQNGKVIAGPPIEENFWQTPDLAKYWSGTQETLESLNPTNGEGYQGFVAYNIACLQRYIHAIQVHPALISFRDMIPRINAFVSALDSPEYAEELNRVTYVLAHKDMHFANIVCDLDDREWPITAVLDWEFSGVVAAPRWNPPRAFLWNGRHEPEDKEERNNLEERFENICLEQGGGRMLEQMKLNPLQDSMQTAVNYIRAIVEVCPRGQAADKVTGWRQVAEDAMSAFVSDGDLV